MFQHLLQAGELSRVHVRRPLGDRAQRRRLESPQHARVVRGDEAQLGAILRARVAVGSHAVERISRHLGQRGFAAAIRRQALRGRDAGVVEVVVREQGTGVAVDALSLAEEQPQPRDLILGENAFGRCSTRQSGRVVVEPAVGEADTPLVGGDRLVPLHAVLLGAGERLEVARRPGPGLQGVADGADLVGHRVVLAADVEQARARAEGGRSAVGSAEQARRLDDELTGLIRVEARAPALRQFGVGDIRIRGAERLLLDEPCVERERLRGPGLLARHVGGRGHRLLHDGEHRLAGLPVEHVDVAGLAKLLPSVGKNPTPFKAACAAIKTNKPLTPVMKAAMGNAFMDLVYADKSDIGKISNLLKKVSMQ